jgi:hypothetical protein
MNIRRQKKKKTRSDVERKKKGKQGKEKKKNKHYIETFRNRDIIGGIKSVCYRITGIL